MPMKHVRLELARDHDFPEGSRERGYELAAPLDAKGRLSAEEWRALREKWDDDEAGFKLDRHTLLFWVNTCRSGGRMACWGPCGHRD